MTRHIVSARRSKKHAFGDGCPTSTFVTRLRLRTIGLALVPLLLFGQASLAQDAAFTADEIRKLVADFKKDPRGPFQAIRWFCPDGSVIGARERCAEPGGLQHALPKDVVVRLGASNGVYLGQILAGTDNALFMDQRRQFSRVKQYQIEQFLTRSDNGWILRQAQFYRGAYQIEDEEAWGKQFLEWWLQRDDLVRSSYFVIREAAKDIPHQAADNQVQRIRTTSKEISDIYPRFLDIRIKIHGQPTASDTALVADFMSREQASLPAQIRTMLNELDRDLRLFYTRDISNEIRKIARRLPTGSEVARDITALDLSAMGAAERVRALALIMVDVRERVLAASRRGRERLTLIDLSIALEQLVFRSVGDWTPRTPRESVEKMVVLSRVAAGTGLLELWEGEQIVENLRVPTGSREFSLGRFEDVVQAARRSVEWGVGTVTAAYEEPVALFAAFEPIANGFLDDRMRATVLLSMGETVGLLAEELAVRSGRSSEVFSSSTASGVRGLNAGVAVGGLEVIVGSPEHVDFRSDIIYALSRAPAELKPVAGIATVSEGNLVSHVQLLARNLGIPNAVVTPDLLRSLEPHSGSSVFYAVSPGGVVRLKRATQMTKEERSLVEERKRSEARIRVPVTRLDLTDGRLRSLDELRAVDSGKVCGPKAANLGQLSSLFPGHVAPGFIIPFAMFRQHMDQTMPGSPTTYWQFLQDTFHHATERRARGASEEEVDAEVLIRLTELRNAIEKMPLKQELKDAVSRRFTEVLGGPVGTVPVFVRSDTNMEDLKDFTGAGLNLTVPNVLTEEAIHQAIRRVWASPYRERGYRWRQKYLLNPEQVYPSLLILRSVNVAKSGVLITAGVSVGTKTDATVAFNQGVGGAVDGQAAESYLIRANGSKLLLSPARETQYTVLPPTGGVSKKHTGFEERILNDAELDQLAELARKIRTTLPNMPGIDSPGPFDVELGFLDGKIWLFQARPFVENRSAAATTYLQAMDEGRRTDGRINLDARLQAAR